MTDELSFKWDEQKRQQTIAKHLIDFKDAVKIFQAAVLVSDSAHPEEERKIAVGLLG